LAATNATLALFCSRWFAANQTYWGLDRFSRDLAA
jgi:hypothetical protein